MGAVLEVLEINHPHAHSPRLVRLSRNIKTVIDAMVHEGTKLEQALQIAGITRSAYLKASSKPEFAAYQQEAMRALRTSEASRTIARAAKLADDAESEHVKLQANTWLAGIEGVSVVTKSENLNVHKHFIPGLTMNLIIGSAPGDDAHLIDGQAREVRSQQQISGLPTPVPHPSMRNAAQIAPETDGQPAKAKARRRAPGGEKP